MIFIELKMHISILEGKKLQEFKSEIEDYIERNPRIWDSLAFCRHDLFDGDMEQISFSLGFRHRNSWQDAGRILIQRGELCRFLYDVAKRLEIQYESAPARRLLYDGGVLEQGQVTDYKKNLLRPTNIRSNSHRQPVLDRNTSVDGPVMGS